MFGGWSCSQNDTPQQYIIENLEIDTIDFPTNFTVNQEHSVPVTYLKTKACTTFYGFIYEKNANVRTVAVQGIRSTNATCATANILATESTTLKIKPELIGDLIFKIYKGKDANGQNIFEEITVPVN